MIGKRIISKKSIVPTYKQTVSNIKRLVNNPKKHLKRTPGSRFEGIKKAGKQRQKAFKNSTKAKLMQISNAIGKRK